MAERPSPSPVRPGSAARVALIGCILTKDEERNIERAVTSLQRATDLVVVVDSESTDDTTAIVRTDEGFAAFTLPAEDDEPEQEEEGPDEEA